ncbi:MAG: cyclodeaminase/cyclohydrolase family protein [Syntrophorhabdaceae bacterium]|nr:cyclodeaminase/cyclohydrolase family protein [Syntrophorhabdaceae bacterium]
MLIDLTVKDFQRTVASKNAVPGGGSVAAYVASLSAGLSEMVGLLSVGKKGDKTLDDRMARVIESARGLGEEMLRAVDKDAEAYNRVMGAYRLPKGTDAEKEIRMREIQDALKEAARVPLSVAEAGVAILGLAKEVVEAGNENAITDGLVGALMARSAVLGALWNVRINLKSIKDNDFSKEMEARVVVLEREAIEIEKDIISLASSRFFL